MKLIPIDPKNEKHIKVLYGLLAERTPEQAISHKVGPTWGEHCAFVANHPYAAWYLLDCEGQCSGPKRYGTDFVGSIYLTQPARKGVVGDEIGIFVFRDYQGLGIGPTAVKLLMEKHGKRRYLANIAPGNEPSRKMFEKLGFKTIQHTLALEVE